MARLTRVLRGDHPRSRGEHTPPKGDRATRQGSSPLTRGALRRRRLFRWRLGIIPAHAGSTLPTIRQRPSTEDHPRSRGEHREDQVNILHGLGSSPLTRGAPVPGGYVACYRGIIPAHAGSTITGIFQTLSGLGIIPAHAGSTPSPPLPRPRRGGSSPLTRGAHDAAMLTPRRIRIIPAHAGSTWSWESHGRPFQDHPRSRGEHIIWLGARSPTIGSSPLTRGAQFASHNTDCRCGIIPAHAGSTWLGKSGS